MNVRDHMPQTEARQKYNKTEGKVTNAVTEKRLGRVRTAHRTPDCETQLAKC